ncbi:MAG: tetratricopeptide repeat protein [Candidatus Latescibacter sp.]|nr:tetratricopeptide repeat protein [Candidatus Latescibacter sp.]
MNENEAQRFLNEQRYQAELPFPVSAVFTHYARSSSKNYALRSLQLVATAQSTIRYTAIAAACDYATAPDADETVLNWLRQEWLGGKKPSFGTWYGALMRLLAESGKSWRNPFVPEFAEIDRELLEKKIQPLIHSRNVEIGHAEYYEALALKHFVELQEENLFAVMEQFSFLSRYPLAFAEVEDDYEPPSPGTKQAVNICRGSSHNFARYTVAPSTPLPPGIPFIWNPEYTGILTLSPFLIYGRATTDAEQKEKVKGVAHIQGLMVLNGVTKGSPVYTSVDAEAQFSLDSFEFPPKDRMQQQVDSALKKGLNVPARKETRLAEEEKELFVRTTDYVSIPEVSREHEKKSMQKQSIAVLPFVNMSADPEQEYFCEGMAEEIINALTHVESLHVVARTSAFSFKGKDIDVREIGRKLDVAHVLEGSVRKAGNRLRITAQLITVADGYHLWSERFDRTLEDVFAIQDEISLAIVRELKVRLLKAEETNVVKRHTVDPEAYELYLKGRYFYNKRHEAGLKKGIECFRQAIEKDPHYALAYAGIADCYNHIGWYGYMHPREAYSQAKTNFEIALELDDLIAEAHYSSAMYKIHYAWDFSGSGKEHKRALELNPNYAAAHQQYSMFFMCMGKFDEAIAEVQRARQLDPLSVLHITSVGMIYTLARRYREAYEHYQRSLEMDPQFLLAHVMLGLNFSGEKKWDKAIASFDTAKTVSASSPFLVGILGYACAMARQKDKAFELLKQLEKLSEERYVSPYYKAFVFAGLDDKDQAFTHLEKAFLEREPQLVLLKLYQVFDSLHDDPRFHALVKKVGLPE